MKISPYISDVFVMLISPQPVLTLCCRQYSCQHLIPFYSQHQVRRSVCVMLSKELRISDGKLCNCNGPWE